MLVVLPALSLVVLRVHRLRLVQPGLRPSVRAGRRACSHAAKQDDREACRYTLGLASHATVIDKGQIVYTSGIEELKANENIRQRYLAL